MQIRVKCESADDVELTILRDGRVVCELYRVNGVWRQAQDNGMSTVVTEIATAEGRLELCPSTDTVAMLYRADSDRGVPIDAPTIPLMADSATAVYSCQGGKHAS